MSGLWRNDPDTPECKYPIVLRRDGSVLKGEYFVIAVRDPCAAAAFDAYADQAEQLELDDQFVRDVRDMADRAAVAADEDPGHPDAPPHRTDDPATLAWARDAHAFGVTP